MNSLLKTSVAALIVATSFSCQKKTDCTANVICKDENDKPIKGATVQLYAKIKTNVYGDVRATGTTDESGKATFIFKLPAIFDIDATINSKKATGIIKLEEGKASEEVLIVK